MLIAREWKLEPTPAESLTLPPPPQNGIHGWLPSAARHARNQGADWKETVRALRAIEPQLRRRYQPREPEDAADLIFSTKGTGTGQAQESVTEKWQPWVTQGINRKIGATVDTLRELSPVQAGAIPAAEILHVLFPARHGILCVGWQEARGAGSETWGEYSYEARTGYIREIDEPGNLDWIVPAYMRKRQGLNKRGKLSMHCDEITGPRVYCVADFDDPPPDQHASIAVELSHHYPLTMVLSSGGKSLHAWFRVPQGRQKDFWRLATRLGADPAVQRNRSSYVRMPNGRRSTNGNRQRAYYLNPDNT